ncbi:hypothetical protein JTB14_035222 [Gonioctena quinquepunctata]|nr:hypothetical protein JTB14_035222 [Gonioctena quinquepunctata]
MFERTLIVKYIPVRDNFIYIPSNLKFLKIGTCLRLSYNETKDAYFSVGPFSAELSDDCIGISSLFAKTLGIEENVLVTFSEISQLASVKKFTISPASQHDYDVIDILSDNIQDTLLNQIRVVYSGQNFIIWIGNNIHVKVHIDEVKPLTPGVIDFLTEVHIDSSSTKNRNESLTHIPKSNEVNQEIIFNQKAMKFYNEFFNNEIILKNNLQKYFNTKQDLVYRLVPMEGVSLVECLLKYSKPFTIFTSKKSIANHWLEESTLEVPVICSLNLMNNDIFTDKTIYARLIAFEDILDDNELNWSHELFVDQQVFETFECELGSRVILKYIENIPLISEITINTRKNYLVNVEEKFKEYLARNSDDFTVLNADVTFNIDDNIPCCLKFSQNDAKFCIVDNSLVRNCTYIVQNDSKVERKEQKVKQECFEFFFDNVSNFKSILGDVKQNFACADGNFENILVAGKPGTGKSTLLKQIGYQLQSYPNFFYIKTMKCKNIKGKTMDSLFKAFSTAFSDLVLHQPSVLLLDDLDVLCENITGDETAPNAIYFDRISNMLHNFFKLFSYPNQIGICGTAASLEKLNKNVYSSRGSHLFKNIHSIEDYTKIDRKVILQNVFADFELDGVNFEKLAMKTEGFVIQDIIDFHNKTIFEAYKEEPDNEKLITINQDHCERALKNTCVLSLQNVQLHSPGDSDFSNIGGLHDIKRVLVENLLWPAQYPGIFNRAPLRLQSGLLLYGPPGTGKTLLAAAAAKQCGLRLISVKGPELLSKYIGASEQAVRDVFQKAQSVKPCMLFFDEFDSLAPRRGHDNTGVTDRVVNQLLTQLDGVESLTGVCVLAATSRPDLLDPALLRPGRLDKQIICPLPDQASRLEILQILSRNLELECEVDLGIIAASTDFFSGADLQSLMYTAQLSSIDHLMDSGKVTTDEIESKVTQKHLLEALRKTKPSLPYHERLKYERIYTKFQTGSTVEDFKAGRATLA